jgi:hypothetical protein
MVAQEPRDPHCVVFSGIPDRTGRLPKPLFRRLCLSLRKGVASLAMATLAFASSASTFIDGIDQATAGVHFEGPGGPASEAPNHNHSLCAMMGATPVLPGAAPWTAVTAGDESRTHVPQTYLTPAGVRTTTCHSRAPPTL